jgi:hypothetical protein
MQGDSGGKVSIFGGDRIGHCEKKISNKCVSNSERLPRYSLLGSTDRHSRRNKNVEELELEIKQIQTLLNDSWSCNDDSSREIKPTGANTVM